MRFLSKIRERQFAKNGRGTYNLSRAVLAGVLAAGCLMPGFAEAAPEALWLTRPEGLFPAGSIRVDTTNKIATITGNISGEGIREEDFGAIAWMLVNQKTSDKGCTINVKGVNTLTITPEIRIMGGYVDDGNAISNTVNISNVTFIDRAYIFGGCSGNPDLGDPVYYSGRTISNSPVTLNTVTIKDTTFNNEADTTFNNEAKIYGGYTSNNVDVTDNTVTIENTTFNSKSYIYGGYTSSDGTVTGNTVTIKGTTFKNKATIYGGYTRTGGTVTGNTVTISGNTTFESSSEIYGGYACDANENSVIISGGNITGLVSGGHGINANKNSVIISGSNITGYVYGGSASNFGTANNNKVILVGEHATYPLSAEQTINGGKIEITGAVFGGSGTSNRSGNQLHVYGSNTTVGNIVNFDNLYFYINENMPSDKVMLTITGNNITDISKSKVLVTFDGAPPAEDDLKTITLIQKTNAGEESIIKAPSKNNITVNCGPALTGSVDLENYGKDLVLTLKNFTVNENGKSLVETRAAAAFVVNNMSDFMLGTGMEQAKAAAGGVTPIDVGTMTPFAAVGGSNMRYTTGSYVDVNGWNGAVGFAKQADKLLFGVAVEHGRGNYDSYLDNGVHASGDIKSTGGVIFGEYKLDNGVHYDAALRAGRVKSDYNSTATSYDESSTYYGFSLGGGKELTVSDKATLDVYGRYYFSHTNGSDVSIATNQEIDFDAVNSHRLRIGGRYTTTLTEKSKAYAGLAWQYEFGGDAKAAINGYSAPTPSLQGHSAIVEAGYKLNAGKNLTLDFNLNGAMGKQRGIGGGIGAQWLF